MNITSAKNPTWANAAQTAVNLDVKFESIGQPVPFTATANDPEAHGRDLFTRATAGEFGPIAASAKTAAQEAAATRASEILARLSVIDSESIRAMRSIARGKATQADRDKLDAIDTEAAALRLELAAK